MIGKLFCWLRFHNWELIVDEIPIKDKRSLFFGLHYTEAQCTRCLIIRHTQEGIHEDSIWYELRGERV